MTTAAEWATDAMASSFTPTERLAAIMRDDPALGADINKLVRAVIAGRGVASMWGCEKTVDLCTDALRPFANTNADVDAMANIARLFGQARRRRKDNQHGARGVVFNKARGKFQASIRIDGRKTYLGLFATAEEAGAAYEAAARKLASV